jgi:hypothetical protein
MFSVKRPCHESDGATRYEFADENNAVPPRVGGFSPDVETQIHFFEIAVQRNWKTQEARVEKQNPTTLRKVSPFSKSISVPDGTSGAINRGSTMQFSIAR